MYNGKKRLEGFDLNELLHNEELEYIFQGQKFLEYIDMNEIRENSKELFPGENLEQFDFPTLYQRAFSMKNGIINEFDKVFFDSIFYNYLKHIFINKFYSNPNNEINNYYENIERIISKFNKKDYIPSVLRKHMHAEGFYLMDKLNITSNHAKFIAGIDHEFEDEKIVRTRILFVEVIPVENHVEYFVAGVDIDFENSVYAIMIKNKTNIQKINYEETQNNTISQLYHFVKNNIIIPLLTTTDSINVKNDREGMYSLCKELDESLLSNVRSEVEQKTGSVLDTSIINLAQSLFIDENELNSVEKNSLKEKIMSLLIANYINKTYKPIKLVKLAKEKKLVGYPTKIAFTSNKNSKGSTQSSSAKIPVSSSDMFHSLYINFKEAFTLEQWSISWFTDKEFTDEKDIDVVQTTIYSKSTCFEVVFKAHRPLNKEFISHVIRKINEYRYREE